MCGAKRGSKGCVCGLVWAGGDVVVATVNTGDCRHQDHGDAAPLPEHVAGNWRAIAAAPDLLARLQRRVTACPCPPPRADGSDHCPDCLADMAVIAKALEG